MNKVAATILGSVQSSSYGFDWSNVNPNSTLGQAYGTYQNVNSTYTANQQEIDRYNNDVSTGNFSDIQNNRNWTEDATDAAVNYTMDTLNHSIPAIVK